MMKKVRKVNKVLTLAVLCAALVFSCAGGAVLMKASAEELNATELVSVGGGASVTAGKRYVLKNDLKENDEVKYPSGTEVGPSGLYVSSNRPDNSIEGQDFYEIELNGIFTGSTTINWMAPNEGFWGKQAEVVFYVQSISDPDSAFEFHIGGEWQQSGYVKYEWEGETLWRSQSTYSNSNEYSYTEALSTDCGFAQWAPYIGDMGNANNHRAWYFGVELQEDGTTEVVSTGDHEFRHREVAASFCEDPDTFEPISDPDIVRGTEPNLPKLDFSEGYTIRIRVQNYHENGSTNASIADFLIDSVVTSDYGAPQGESNEASADTAPETSEVVRLNGGTVEMPEWYKLWQNYRKIEIEEHKDFNDIYVGCEIAVPGAAWTSGESTEPAAVETIEAVKPSGEKVSVKAGELLKITEAGEWTLIYRTYDEELGKDFEVSYSFTAVSERSVEAKEILNVDGAPVTLGEDALGSRGLTVNADGKAAYRGELGRFTKDAAVEFSLPQRYNNQYTGAGAEFVFTIRDLSGNEAFEIVYKNTDWFTSAYIRRGTEIRAWVEDGSYDGWNGETGTMFYTEPRGDAFMVIPGAGIANKGTGKLELIWEENILTVAVTNRNGSQTTLAKFDGSEPYTSAELDENGNIVLDMDAERRYGLPKMDGSDGEGIDLTSGYTVSFSTEAKTLPVTFVSVNGLSFSDKLFFRAQEVKAGEAVLKGVVREGDTYYLPEGEGTQEYLTEKTYYAMLAAGWEVVIKTEGIAAIDVSAVAEPSLIEIPFDDFGQGLSSEILVAVEQAVRVEFSVPEGGHGSMEKREFFVSEHYRPDRSEFDSIAVSAEEGYTFLGWYAEGNSDEEFVYADLLAAVSDCRVFARFADSTPPEVGFAEGIVNEIASSADDFSVSPSDVVATDGAGPVEIIVTVGGTVYEGGSLAGIISECMKEYEVVYTVSDGAGNSASISRTLILTHALTKTEAKEATCTEAGNIEYWTCSECGKYFSDAEGETEITLEDTIIAAKGHHFENGECTVCGEKDPDYEEDDEDSSSDSSSGTDSEDSTAPSDSSSGADSEDGTAASDSSSEDGGCGSRVSVGFFAVLSVLGAVVVMTKKRGNEK